MTPVPITKNTLYYGDNLTILREHIPDQSVDLIYLDPPFNSQRSYNVLFRDEGGTESESQIAAFDDTWHWGADAEATYHELVTQGPARVSKMIAALREFIGSNQMMAYLVMMAARLVELHRVLRATGSLYLHCDPTASHYLKIILDTIFGPQNFRNELIWERTTPKGLSTRRLPTNHDVLLCYQKTDQATWNSDAIFMPYDPNNLSEKTASKYCYRDPDGRLYRLSDLTNPNRNRPNLDYEFLGVRRVWRWTKERMQAAYEAGLIVQSSPGTVPALKRYLDEQRGRPLSDVWTDISPINSQAKERLGYPTQKPLALLERIIQISSNPGDWVLDPFCGCGTAVAAAQKLDRRWIGIDITHLAIALQRYRLQEMYPGIEIRVIGEPESLSGARSLAEQNRHQFEWWALSLARARPSGESGDPKRGRRGADRGIDGIITFIDEARGKAKQVLVQVKSGHVGSAAVRDLRGTMDREKAAIGVLITLEPPTSAMETEAVSAGFYHSPGFNRDYPRLQILTIEKLLAGAKVQMPGEYGTFKQADRVQEDGAIQGELEL